MIRPALVQEASALDAQFSPTAGVEHVLNAKPQSSERGATESVENEISRLTWSVLDGRATPAEKNRLAELVSAQHQRRHREESGKQNRAKKLR